MCSRCHQVNQLLLFCPTQLPGLSSHNFRNLARFAVKGYIFVELQTAIGHFCVSLWSSLILTWLRCVWQRIVLAWAHLILPCSASAWIVYIFGPVILTSMPELCCGWTAGRKTSTETFTHVERLIWHRLIYIALDSRVSHSQQLAWEGVLAMRTTVAVYFSRLLLISRKKVRALFCWRTLTAFRMLTKVLVCSKFCVVCLISVCIIFIGTLSTQRSANGQASPWSIIWRLQPVN